MLGVVFQRLPRPTCHGISHVGGNSDKVSRVLWVTPHHLQAVYYKVNVAKVAELVDALDLGSSGATRESSSLSFRTSYFCWLNLSFYLDIEV